MACRRKAHSIFSSSVCLYPFPKDNDSRVRFGGARSSAHRAASARSAAKEAATDATLTETTFMTLASGRAAEMLKRPCANREAHRVRRKAILPVINNNKIIKANIPARVLNIFEYCQAMKKGVVGELWSSCVDGRRAKNVEGILSGKMAASSSRAWLSASSFRHSWSICPRGAGRLPCHVGGVCRARSCV